MLICSSSIKIASNYYNWRSKVWEISPCWVHFTKSTIKILRDSWFCCSLGTLTSKSTLSATSLILNEINANNTKLKLREYWKYIKWTSMCLVPIHVHSRMCVYALCLCVRKNWPSCYFAILGKFAILCWVVTDAWRAIRQIIFHFWQLLKYA